MNIKAIPRELLEPIAARFAELQDELERTHGELEAARSRISSDETFEVQLREAISATLLRTQDALVPRLQALRDEVSRAESDRNALQAEVNRLREERDGLEATVATLRPVSTELRNASAETLRSVLHEVLAEMRGDLAKIATPTAPRPQLSAPAVEPPKIHPMVDAAEEVITSEPVEEPEPRSDSHVRQIELVLRSLRSFPQLIAIENRIQSFPGVQRVYAHRTGDGAATLTVHLDPTTDRDGFVATLERNDRPQLLVESVSGDLVEARVAQ